jgi:hypothetical protein
MKQRRVLVQKTVNNHYDEDAVLVGTDIEHDTITYYSSIDPFFLEYADFINKVDELDKTTIKVLKFIAIEMEVDKLFYKSGKPFDTQACDRCGIVQGTYRNCLTKLNRSDIIRRVARGIYMVNPTYFFKGDVKGRGKKYGEYERLPEYAKDSNRINNFEKWKKNN